MKALEWVKNKFNKEGVTVTVIRHGDATYGSLEGRLGYGPEIKAKGERDPNIARDLNIYARKSSGMSDDELVEGREKVVDKVRAKAREIASSIKKTKKIVIWSSPAERTLDTARIIRDELQNLGFNFKDINDETNIKIFERFEDIRSFNYEYFVKLADGGTLVVDGKEIFLDKKVTNPRSLNYAEYYLNEEYKNIPTEYLKYMPQVISDFIKVVEAPFSVKKRIYDSLKKLFKVSKDIHLIIVTHGALTDDLVKSYNPNILETLPVSEFVNLEKVGDKMLVSFVSAFPEQQKIGDGKINL
jgi:hypothetical protein